MLAYVYHVLSSFRSQFARRRTWLLFCAVVLGFLGTSPVDGITAFCRFFHFGDSGYHAMLHFFRSNAWNLETLSSFWWNFIMSQNHHLQVDERVLLLGDHIYIPKDGRRMPGLVAIHQDSETQTKPSYFRGHRWAALGLIIGSWKQPSCLPLTLRLHQGFAHLGQEVDDEGHKQTLGQRMIQMALEAALQLRRPAILVLDAFFSVSTVFRAASEVMLKDRPYLTVLVRAKKNYVAHEIPKESEQKKMGRRRKYGNKLKLHDVFDQEEEFEQAQALIYGKEETIRYKAQELVWKPLKGSLLFIWVHSSRGMMVLMCNDLNIDPIQAIECYSLRIRVEVMFGWLKGLLGAFCYRFWSKGLPAQSRRPTKNSLMEAPPAEKQKMVTQVWECYEKFVLLGAISLGILQLLALKFSKNVWRCFHWYLRSRSRQLPSVRTVKAVLSRQIVEDFGSVACHATMQELRESYTQTHPPFSETQNVEFKEAA